jgi:hypothetical protein
MGRRCGGNRFRLMGWRSGSSFNRPAAGASREEERRNQCGNQAGSARVPGQESGGAFNQAVHRGILAMVMNILFQFSARSSKLYVLADAG